MLFCYVVVCFYSGYWCLVLYAVNSVVTVYFMLCYDYLAYVNWLRFICCGLRIVCALFG